MKYSDGRPVTVGDRVKFDDDDGGIVVCSMDDGEYTDAHPKEQWGYLGKGVMIEFPRWGLIHFEKSDEDLELIARAKPGEPG